MRLQRPPKLEALLKSAGIGEQPVAIVLAGHNGLGKSTLWYERLADTMQIPLVNADRLTLSLLPEPTPIANSEHGRAACEMKINDGTSLRRMACSFSCDGNFQSKVDVIRNLQKHGYFVVLLFVGLASVELSILRVSTRRVKGGHDVPEDKLRGRFPRTQQAIGMAARVADLTLMFDNSRDEKHAFTLVRAQRKEELLYDCRARSFEQHSDLLQVADLWLRNVVPL